MEKVHNLVVEEAGVRLDKFVSEGCPELSRTQAQRLIDEGYITVNTLVMKASHKLDVGDRIEIIIPISAAIAILVPSRIRGRAQSRPSP